MRISLRKRKLPRSGRVSLSIEYYKGSETSPEGKRRHIRDFENLKLYLYSDPKNGREVKENEESLKKAEKILKERQEQYFNYSFKVSSQKKEKINSRSVSKVSKLILDIKRINDANLKLKHEGEKNREMILKKSNEALNYLFDIKHPKRNVLFKEITDILFKNK